MNKEIEMNKLIEDILKWGAEKGITGYQGRGTLLGQLSKTQEELTETRDAAVKWLNIADVESLEATDAITEVIDGIGDCMVTLILAAEVAGLDSRCCLEFAYDQIKNRTGKMENGQFVKDA